MARYDRRFLVPYLQDVCSVELLLIRLNKEDDKVLDNIWRFENRIKNDPRPQKVTEYPMKYAVKALIRGLICLAISFLCACVRSSTDSYVLEFISMISSFPMLVVAGVFFWIAKAEYDDHCESTYDVKVYEKKLKEWYDRAAERDKNQQQADFWRNRRKLIQSHIKEVQNLRKRVYDVNVIPHQYRNVYAAHFLYDFFRGGQADDLEQVIAIFVLEEIKARLDRVIEQQTDIIVNQRVMIANQERTNKQIAENHRREMEQYARLNENAERRNQYLEMINTNLVISNYFAYNDYIKKG